MSPKKNWSRPGMKNEGLRSMLGFYPKLFLFVKRYKKSSPILWILIRWSHNVHIKDLELFFGGPKSKDMTNFKAYMIYIIQCIRSVHSVT